MNDPVEWAKSVASVVKTYCGAAIAPVLARLAILESLQPQKGESGKDGRDGVDGKDGAPGTNGTNGADGKDGLAGKDGADGKDGVDGKDADPQVILALVAEAVAALPAAKDGKNGIDGKDADPDVVRTLVADAVAQIPRPRDGKDGAGVTVDQVMPELKAELQRAVSALPLPKDGAPGKDGKSVTVEDFLPIFETAVVKALLDMERRGMETIQRCMDRIEKPKDGKDGRDGVDGLGYEDFTEEFDGERTITRTYERGGQKKTFVHKFPVVLERGIHKHGQSYERGDGVTFGGNYWIAQRDTSDKPGESDAWRLAVRKGRDGKDSR